MSAIKHTPGPWICEIVAHDQGGWKSLETFISVRAKDALVAHYPTSYVEYPATDDENEANARLMAAAPDLLKACRQAIVALKGREHDGFLRDAIAKATGEAA